MSDTVSFFFSIRTIRYNSYHFQNEKEGMCKIFIHSFILKITVINLPHDNINNTIKIYFSNKRNFEGMSKEKNDIAPRFSKYL